MGRTRVLEIIAAYGADACRWPAAEREPAQALVASDPALQAEVASARALDAELAAWAMAPVAAGDIDAAAASDAATRSSPTARRWWPAALGASVAASLLALIAVLPTSSSDPTSGAGRVTGEPPAIPVQTAEVEQDVQLMGSVFTLTPEEESLI